MKFKSADTQWFSMYMALERPTLYGGLAWKPKISSALNCTIIKQSGQKYSRIVRHRGGVNRFNHSPINNQEIKLEQGDLF